MMFWSLSQSEKAKSPISVPNVIIPSDFDCNQYDSQELVADYDHRSEVMRDLYLKTMISPSQDLMLHSNNSTHLPPNLNHVSSHLAPISVPNGTIPFDFDCSQYDSQELVADYDDNVHILSHLQHIDEEDMVEEYDDESQMRDELSSNTPLHHSQHLVSHYSSQIEADAEVDSNLLTIAKKKRRGNKQPGQRRRQNQKV